MCSATSVPFFVSLIILIRPFFSKLTSPSFSRICRILTAWEYVQSTSFASCEPYFARETFFRAMSIMAGFLLKNRSKLSPMLCLELYVLMYILELYSLLSLSLEFRP